MAGPSTTLILPIHNQADHVRDVSQGYLDAAERIDVSLELLLVTNACTDDSVSICSEMADRLGAVTHLDLSQPGWGRSVRAGIRQATGDYIGYTNSARTTPEMLALMLSYARAYPGVVLKANRKIRDNWRRRLGSLLYNLECRALFDLAVWDINGTPKIFPRSCTRLLELKRDDDLIDAEFAFTCRMAGYPVVEVPILATVRHGGRSTTNYASALRMYRGAIELRRQMGPP